MVGTCWVGGGLLPAGLADGGVVAERPEAVGDGAAALGLALAGPAAPLGDPGRVGEEVPLRHAHALHQTLHESRDSLTSNSLRFFLNLGGFNSRAGPAHAAM